MINIILRAALYLRAGINAAPLSANGVYAYEDDRRLKTQTRLGGELLFINRPEPGARRIVLKSHGYKTAAVDIDIPNTGYAEYLLFLFPERGELGALGETAGDVFLPGGGAELRITREQAKKGSDQINVLLRGAAALPAAFYAGEGSGAELCVVREIGNGVAKLAEPLRSDHKRGEILRLCSCFRGLNAK